MRLLFTVSERFTVEGRGLVLIPESWLTHDEWGKVGDKVVLRRPRSTDDTATVSELESIQSSTGRRQIVIMLNGKRKEHVPVGTEVWLL